MLTTVFGETTAGSALRIPLLSSSTVTVERLIGQRTEGESSRAVARVVGVGRDLVWWPECNVTTSASGSDEGRTNEEERDLDDTRVSMFEPNEIYGIMSHAREICSGRCAHVFTLLFLPQEQR